ncbi:MAG: hypothetical protein GY930_09190 [bacterium]|nr:hypothetical protein [bacterium]
MQFIPLGLPWFFGDKVGVRQDLVHALLGSSNLLTRDGLEIWILPDTAMGYVGIILAFLAAMPLLGGYYFPLSRHQRARLVFWNTVRYGLGGAVALVVVGCAVGYGLRALGEPIEVASVPLSLRLGLLFVAVFPLFVVVALKGISLGKPNLAFGLSILVGYALVKALRWVVDASHVLALGPGPLAFSYLGFSFLSYWACCLLIQHHFRRADLIPNPGTCS